MKIFIKQLLKESFFWICFLGSACLMIIGFVYPSPKDYVNGEFHGLMIGAGFAIFAVMVCAIQADWKAFKKKVKDERQAL